MLYGYTGVDIHTEEAEGTKLRVDYFDTKQQVREYVKREAEAARAAKEQAKQKKRQSAKRKNVLINACP